jgi:hypothetical protein
MKKVKKTDDQDLTVATTTVRTLLSRSRINGPARCFVMDPDGRIASVSVRPPRSPYVVGRLTPEQVSQVLKATGNAPEPLPPSCSIGVQAHDLGSGPWRRMASRDLAAAGLLTGVIDNDSDDG